MNPHAREEKLVVQEVSDETLVYDRNRDRAHCLNPTAAFVWRHCDGKTSISELAKLLQDEFGILVNEEVVWLALDRLARAHLLRERVKPEPQKPRYSRRQLMRRLGRIGVAMPVVLSVVSPAVAQGSCITKKECTALIPPFCFGQPICPPPPNKCCVPSGPTNCKQANC